MSVYFLNEEKKEGCEENTEFYLIGIQVIFLPIANVQYVNIV